MSYHYKILLNDGETTIGPIAQIERTDSDFTFLDQNNNIVAMLSRDLIQGFVPITTPLSEQALSSNAPVDDTSPTNQIIEFMTNLKATQEKMEQSIGSMFSVICGTTPLFKQTQSELTKSTKPTEPSDVKPNDMQKKLPPVNPTVQSIESAIRHTSKPVVHMRKNNETKGYEVHIKSKTVTDKQQQVEPQETNTNASNAGKTKKKQNEKLVQMQYRDILAIGVYDPDTKQVLIEKGTLIAKRETQSLVNSPSKNGIRVKRHKILRESAKPFNPDYCILTKDILFSSLSQAGCVLSGAIIKPSEYWRDFDAS